MCPTPGRLSRTARRFVFHVSHHASGSTIKQQVISTTKYLTKYADSCPLLGSCSLNQYYEFWQSKDRRLLDFFLSAFLCILSSFHIVRQRGKIRRQRVSVAGRYICSALNIHSVTTQYKEASGIRQETCDHWQKIN